MSLDDLSSLGTQVGVAPPPSVGAEIAALAEAPPPLPEQAPSLPRESLLGPDGPSSARGSLLQLRTELPEATPRDIARRRQAVTGRQAQIMAASSYEEVAQAIQPDDDPIRTAARSVAFEVYSNRVPGAEAAQVDFARFDHAVQAGVVQDPDSVALWRKMSAGQLLTEKETEQLSSSVQSFAETLDISPSDDLSVGLTGRVTRVQKVSSGLATQVSTPLGWDDGKVADPQTRLERVQSLNLASFREQGTKNIEKLHAFAVERGLDHVNSDGFEPFVGAKLDLEEPVTNDVVLDAYQDLAERLNQPLDQVVGMVAAAWQSISENQQGSWADGTPFALPSELGPNPIVDALMGRTEGPFSLQSASFMQLPAEALEITAGDGLVATAFPDGNVVYAAEITEDAASAARHLHPGVVGADRVPRWIPSTPAKVADMSRGRRLIDFDAHAETYLDMDLQRSGGHPLFKPGNYITFEMPADQPATAPMGATKQDLGRVVREVPGLSLERLSVSDLDPDKLMSPGESQFKTHAWASFAGGESKAWVAELRRQGYRTVNSDSGYVVFGIPSEEAEALGEKYGVMVSTPEGGDDVTHRINVGGKTVAFDPMEWRDDVPPPRRRSESHRRIEVTVPRGEDPGRMAADLEARGARAISVYAHAKHLDGFEKAYESAFSDGIETIVVRHAKGDLAAAHGGHVFVRSASGLPDEPSQIPLAPPDEMEPDESDLIPAVQAARDRGDRKVGSFDVVQAEQLKAPERLAKSRDGIPIPKPRRDRPKPEWEDEFGVEFDPGYRVGNKVMELPPETQKALAGVMRSFVASDGAALDRFSLSRVVVSFVDGDEPAVTEWQPGGSIVLSRNADPKTLPAALRGELEAIRDLWQ